MYVPYVVGDISCFNMNFFNSWCSDVYFCTIFKIADVLSLALPVIILLYEK